MDQLYHINKYYKLFFKKIIVNLLGNTKDLDSILVAKFTVMLEVPSGKAQTKTSDLQGMIEISFETVKWDHIKTGVADRSKFPCKAITGVLPG